MGYFLLTLQAEAEIYGGTIYGALIGPAGGKQTKISEF